jgi:YHS domain-containing protein
LRHVGHPVALYEVVEKAGPGHETVDPVCFMQLAADSEISVATADGRRDVFCSPECRDQFRNDPALYRG